MNQYIPAIAMVVSIAYQKCAKPSATALPLCIRDRIAEIKKQPRRNPPARVNEYRYRGKRVFLFSSSCCDQYNEVVDENCNLVCAPSGGLTGRGDGKCAGFNDSAMLVRLVWKDER